MFETGISYGNEKPNDDVVDIHQYLYLPMVELNTESDPRKFYGNGFSVLLCSLEKNIDGNGHTKIRSGRDPDRKIYRIGPYKLPRARNRQKQTHNTLTYISYTQHTHTHTHTYRQSHK